MGGRGALGRQQEGLRVRRMAGARGSRRITATQVWACGLGALLGLLEVGGLLGKEAGRLGAAWAAGSKGG